MEVTRFADAQAYEAPMHFDMTSLRLQGFGVSGADFAWVGLSHILPGGGAEMDAGPLGKIYVVIEGEVTVTLGDGDSHVLRKLDSCFIPAGEAREVRNKGNAVATMIVVMPYPRQEAMTLPSIDPSKLFDVRGKSALVVGATGAFGKVVCATLGSAGRQARPSPPATRRNWDSCAWSCRRRAFAAVAIARRPNTEADCDAIVAAAVAAHGRVDILVVASGMNDVAPIVEMAPERFQKVMLANVEGAWLIARAAGRQMIAQGGGGKVVFTSSARGKLGHPAGYSAYCTSKSAVDGMTKALGCEWGKHGITVNAIAPTVFRSPLTAWMFDDDEKATAVRAGIPGARAHRAAGRAGGPGRSPAVSVLARLGLSHRPHRLRRRRLHGGVAHGSQ